MHSLPGSDVDYVSFTGNKELFAKNKKGECTLPKTFREMAVADEKLNDPAKGSMGFDGRGLRKMPNDAVDQFFLTYGGELSTKRATFWTDGRSRSSHQMTSDVTRTAPPGVAVSTGWSRWTR